jgi:hypothetical protein
MRKTIPTVAALLIIAMAGSASGAARSAPPQPRAATALVLRYAFDSNVGSAVRDSAPGAPSGLLVNADPATAYVTSLPAHGRALSLVGADHQYVAVPERAALDVNRFTLAAMVRPTGIQNDATNGRWEILEKAGAYWINLRTDGHIRVGGFFGSCSGGSAWVFVDSAAAIPLNTWTHVAGTYNGSKLTVWVNGQRAGTKNVTGRTCSNDEPLAVAAKNAPSKGILDAFWDGRLDEVRVYSRALGAAEIAALVP